MSGNPKISVIIPVYNAEAFLQETLECLEKQTYDNIEVILIDDGSTDTSKEICSQFVASNSMFKYYYQDNRGASTARNNGIEKASGKYICFMDADDLCEDTWIESLIDVISNSEAPIGMLGWRVIDENYKTLDIIRNKDALLNVEDAIVVFTSLGGSVWNKVFEKNLITSDAKGEKILFDEQQKYSEDIIFCVEALCKAKKIQVSSKSGYIYRNRSGSISHQKGVKQIFRYENMLCGQEKMVRLLESNLNIESPAAHKFYCASNFYAMLDLYMSGIQDTCIYKRYSNVILNDNYSTIKLRVIAKIILLSPSIIFKPWIILRQGKRKIKEIMYMKRKRNGKK